MHIIGNAASSSLAARQGRVAYDGDVIAFVTKIVAFHGGPLSRFRAVMRTEMLQAFYKEGYYWTDIQAIACDGLSCWQLKDGTYASDVIIIDKRDAWLYGDTMMRRKLRRLIKRSRHGRANHT